MRLLLSLFLTIPLLAQKINPHSQIQQVGATNGQALVWSNAIGGYTPEVLPLSGGGTATATQFTQGSIVFAGALGVYSQDNANLFYDASTHTLTLTNLTVSACTGCGTAYTSLTQDGTTGQLAASKGFNGPVATGGAGTTPTIDLATCNRCEMPTLTANVTAVTFTHLKNGTSFDVVWTQDGTGGRTVAYGGPVSNACQVTPVASKATTQHFEIDSSGNIIGQGCPSGGPPALILVPSVFSPTYPACSAATEGWEASISDSTTNTWGATITGGGANHVAGYCDGTHWTVFSTSQSYTDGQLLIGNTSTGGLTKAVLTAGANVTITNAGGSITIASSGGGGGSTNTTPYFAPWGNTPTNSTLTMVGGATATLYVWAFQTDGAMTIGKVLSNVGTSAHYAWALYTLNGSSSTLIATGTAGAGCGGCTQSVALASTLTANTTYYLGFSTDTASFALTQISPGGVGAISGTVTLVPLATAANTVTWSGGVPTFPATTGALTANTTQANPWVVLTY